MCHQSVGLLQGAIEAAGMSTIGLTVRPEITVNMNVPRAAYVRFPTGNPVGQPHMPNQQRTILRGVLRALEAIQQPGTVVEMPYRWKRMPDEDATRLAPRTLPKPPPPTQTDLYSAAEAQVRAVQDAYTQLLEQVERYRAWVQAVVAEEQAKPAPDHAKLQSLGPQLKYLTELTDALDGPTHDALIRVSDRVIRIKHWQDGAFI